MPESRCRTRRRWSVEFKRQVVAEASAPGVSVAAVARRYDLNANLVFNWRRRYGGGGVFLPVAIPEPAGPAPGVAERASERVAGEIEVALPPYIVPASHLRAEPIIHLLERPRVIDPWNRVSRLLHPPNVTRLLNLGEGDTQFF